MVDRDITISNLETNIRWIEDIPSHQFPGWGNVTMSMRDALELLKEQEAKTGHWVSVNDGDVVPIDSDGSPKRACFCSECKKYLIASDEYAVYGRYCPFCGAKMEGR